MRGRIAKAATALSLAGLTLIATYEGKRNEAYLDPVGIPTICYGHIKTAKLGQYKDDQECVTLLSQEASEYASAVLKLTTAELTQGQLDALTSFTYNLGRGNYAKSTLRKKLNAGDYCGAAREFPKWNRAGGKVLRGLVKRRAAEQARFMEGLSC